VGGGGGGGKLLNIKFVFWFSLQSLSETSYFKKNWAKYNNYCILVFTYSSRHAYHILMKLEFPRQIFEKYSNIKFHGNPSCSSRVVPCRRTDGRTGMTNLIVNFRNFSNSPKNSTRGLSYIQGGSNMTGTKCGLFTHKSVPVIFEPPGTSICWVAFRWWRLSNT